GGPCRTGWGLRAPHSAGGRGSSSALQPRDHAPPGEGDEADFPRHAGLEAHPGPCGDVEAEPLRRRTVERQRRIHVGEVEVRAHLHRPVAGVLDHEAAPLPAGVELDQAVRNDHLTGDHHGIGWWRVTSLVPSGKVASTWTSCRSSGTPSITSSRLSTARPADMRSATVRPSRAPSSTKDESRAVASGTLSFTPLALRSRATIA